MNNVIIIDPNRYQSWNRFVYEHPFGWLVHLSGWKSVLEKSFPHMKGYYFAFIDVDKNSIKAALPLFLVKSWLTGTRLVSIPFSTLSDPLVSSAEDLQILFEEVKCFFEEKGGSYIELRTLKANTFLQKENFAQSTHFCHHYIDLNEPPEKLKKKFHRSCVRQKISRANKSNINLKVGKEEQDLKEFYRLYFMSRKRLGLPPQPYRFLKELWNTFFPAKQLMLLLAETEGSFIAGLILFMFKKRVSAEFSVIDESFSNISPNHLLFWEAIKISYDNGYEIFDFGRTSCQNTGLLNFKRRWNTKQIDLPIYFYPKEIGNKLCEIENSIKYKISSNICGYSPQPVLRMIGNFCYRHLG